MSKDINDALTEFLTNPENKILVLKGKWGVGKTYFWKNFFEDNKTKLSDDQKQIISNVLLNYSYVSLFGISDINELKNKIFTSASPIKSHPSIWNGSITKEKIVISAIFLFILFFIFTPSLKILGVMALLAFLIAFWFDHFKHLSFWVNFCKKETYKNIDKNFWSLRNAGKFLNHINKLAIIKRYIGDSSNFISNNYIENMLICFDDIERIDSKLPIETLMGYADELAQQKNCKIILIFNEDELEEKKQKKNFNKYREKVVDIELTYSPTLNKQLEIAFGDKLAKYPIINKVINDQEYENITIKNIRILTKINQIIDNFIKISPTDLNALITEDFIKRAIYLSYCFYEINNKVPFKIIKDPSKAITQKRSASERLGGPAPKKEEQENIQTLEYDDELYKQTIKSAKHLHINKPSIFTEEIIHKLEHGYWSTENLKSFISSEVERIDVITKQSEIRKRLDCAWHLYHSSFQNNLDDIINIFEKELEDLSNYPYWDYGHFIHTLGYYYNFQKLKNTMISAPLHHIDTYISLNAEQLKQMTWEDRLYINLNTSNIDPSITDYAMQKLDIIQSQKSKTPLSAFIKTLERNSRLSDEQKIYIQNLTLPEIESWLNTIDDIHMREYIHNLRICSASVQNGPDRDNPDDSNTLINQALDNIASQSALNRYRIDRLIKSKS